MKTTVLAPKISLPELARRWGWKASRLYRLCAAKRIPHVKIGRDIFFEEEALDQWLSKQRRGDQAESGAPARRHRSVEAECERLGIPVDHDFR